MKLFLASSADKSIQFLEKLASDVGKKVLFVANAADPYRDRSWVDWDKDRFRKLGYELQEVDLRKESPESVKQFLRANDILHVCGGSVYYLLSLINEKNLAGVISQAVRNGIVVYTGTSAGSIIVSENVRAFSHDKEEEEHVKKVPDHKGLGLIQFGIVPHCNSPESVNEHKVMVEHMPTDPTALFYIHDHQALWVEDGKVTLVEAK